MRRSRQHQVTSRQRNRNGRRGSAGADEAQPLIEQRGKQIQTFGSVVRMPIALDAKVREQSARQPAKRATHA